MIEIIAAVFILLFAYTAINKLIYLKHFVFYLRKFSLFRIAPYFLAWSVVLSESLIVFLLVYPPLRKWGFVASFVLMLSFTFFIGYMIFSSEKLPCSCGGVLKQLSWKSHFALNIFLTMMAAVGILLLQKINKNKKPVEFLLQ